VSASPYPPPATNPSLAPVAHPPSIPLSLWFLGLTCAGVLVLGLWIVPVFRQMFLEVGVVPSPTAEITFRASELPYLPLVVLLPLWAGFGLLRSFPRALPWFTLGWSAVCFGLPAVGMINSIVVVH